MADKNDWKKTAKGFIFTISGFYLAAMLAGFSLTVKKPISHGSEVSSAHERPSRLAARALAWGTFFAVAGSAGLSIAVGYALGARSVSIFNILICFIEDIPVLCIITWL